MPKAVFYCSYKLKKDVNKAEFLLVAEKLNNEYISQQLGYIGWQQLVEEDTWLDLIFFETMSDAENFVSNSEKAGKLAEDFYFFINLNSCKQHIYLVEKEY